MKKWLVIAVAAMACACASGGKAVDGNAGMMDLDTAIQQASMEMNGELSEGTKVALLNFSSDSDVFSDYVLKEMEDVLVKERKLVVVDRGEIDLIRGEMNFQMSGEVSDASAQEIGIKLGAQSIVSGSLMNLGDSYRFRIRVINVESARVEATSSATVKDDSLTRHLLSQGKRGPAPQAAVAQGGAAAGVQGAAAQATPAPTPAVPAAPVYKVGDTGPAGGLVFYDKGNNSGGWRYLEVAPASTDREPANIYVGTNPSMDREFRLILDRRLGAGKENTIMLMGIFEKYGGGINSAAWICDNLIVNDFDDWYQPSLDELIMLYTNTYAKDGSGEFRSTKYRSSTCKPNGLGIAINFSNGREEEYGENDRVRAVRRF